MTYLDLPEPPAAFARLTAHVGRGRAATLTEHRRTFAPPIRARRGAATPVIDAADAAGLRGRGGASFPTATKLRAVAGGRGRPIVIANGSEGEPTSRKDVHLMTLGPHLVLDGAELAAAAVGAVEVYVAMDARATDARASVERAIHERARVERTDRRVRIVEVPPGYVAGEERSLTHLLNRGPAIPTTGPRPFVKGVRGRPTLIQNVETLAHLATIAAFGPSWFRSIGTAEAPGSMLLTLSGAVRRPGVYEIPVGAPLTSTIGLAGGPSAGIGGVLVGGYAGSWLPPEVVDEVTLDPRGMAAAGGILGAGIVVVLPAGACGWSETASVLRWLAGQTAGQCGPCVLGLEAIAGAAERIVSGTAVAGELDRLDRWAGDVEGRGACRMPDGAMRVLRSALDVFAEDVRGHLRGRRCTASRDERILPVPRPPSEAAA
jgi:NADH:ubiquinone oxidoreductase subunit F (NADH-binding)